MVVVAIFFIILAVALLPIILKTVDGFSKSKEEQDLEKAEAKTKQKRIEDEGFFKTAGRVIAGDKFFDDLEDSLKSKQFEKETKIIKSTQAKDKGFKSIEELERKTDPNRDITKFNPKGKIGFGITGINDGKGLEDTEANRKLIGLTPDFGSKEDNFIAQKNKRGSRNRAVFF